MSSLPPLEVASIPSAGRIPQDSTAGGERRRSTFAIGMALAMFVTVLVGFGPTLFLRPLFDVPEIPARLYLHGFLLTAWYGWLVLQAGLVFRNRISLHRRLGIIGAVLGLAVLLSGLHTSIGFIPRQVALGVDVYAPFFSLIVGANYVGLIDFAVLFGLAIGFRRRPSVHRRLMLLAAFAFVTPAVTRIASWMGDLPNAFLASSNLFLIAIVAHDLLSTRRVHLATIAGIAFMLAVGVGFNLSGAAEAIIALQTGRQ